MAAFYILPPRDCLESAVSELFTRLLPGLPLPADTWDYLIERLTDSASWPADLFLVPRDDLPAGEPLSDALAIGFGAEEGDRVIEVRSHAEPRTWTLGPTSVSVPALAR